MSGAEPELWTLLSLGALIGMQHALEADHLAAVAAMSTKRSSRRALVMRGALWGTGHTVALFVFCGAVLLAGLVLTARMEAALEFAVGVMIVGLGLNVLRKLWTRRVHFHVHSHSGGARHVHAHAHEGKVAHAQSAHAHTHPRGFLKPVAIGLVHGAAGSGALLVLVAASAPSPLRAMAYVACFGVGSILGMAALSFVASFPLKAVERSAAQADRLVTAAIGAFALYIGAGLMAETWPGLGF